MRAPLATVSNIRLAPRMMLLGLALYCFAPTISPVPAAFAQQQNKEKEQTQAAPLENDEKQQDNGLLPPLYDDKMQRLSEILGALHYLRQLCGADEGQLWRDEMTRLIAQENPASERKERMIARFNRGFRGYQEVYHKCTPSAVEAGNRYVSEGIRLSAEIPSRYGN